MPKLRVVAQKPRIKPWTFKNIPPEERNAATTHVETTGGTLGEFVRRAIRTQIQVDLQAGSRRMPVVQDAPGEVAIHSLKLEALPAAEAADATGAEPASPADQLHQIERMVAVAMQVSTMNNQPPPPAVTKLAYGLMSDGLRNIRRAVRRAKEVA